MLRGPGPLPIRNVPEIFKCWRVCPQLAISRQRQIAQPPGDLRRLSYAGFRCPSMAAHTGRTWHGRSGTSMLAVTVAGMWTLRPAVCTCTAPLASLLHKVKPYEHEYEF